MTKAIPSADLERRRLLKSMAAIGGTGLFAGCIGDGDDPPVTDDDDGDADADDDDDGQGTDKRGGTFRLSSIDVLTSLDPRQSTLSWFNVAAHHMYDGLLMRSPDGSEYVPHLAAEGPEKVDELTYTIPLREGVMFHHGEEMTAEDVAYSINWQLDPDNPAENRGEVNFISEVEASGTYEATFHLEQPHALLEDTLFNQWSFVIPKAYAEDLGHEEFQHDPVGTGPFKFDFHQEDEAWGLERFDDYFLGSPHFDAVEYRFIPELEVSYVELATGGLEQSRLPDDFISEADDDENINVQRRAGFNFRGCIINCLSDNFEDVRAREAIHHLTTQEDFALASRPNAYELNCGFMPEQINEVWDFPCDEWREEYYPEEDKDRAQELLEEAGVYSTLQEEPVDLITVTGEVRVGPMLYLQRQFEEIGIEADIREMDIGGWVEALYGGDFDVSLHGFDNVFDPDGYYYRLRDLTNDPGGKPDHILGTSDLGYAYEAYRGSGTQMEDDLARLDELAREGRATMEMEARYEIYVEAVELAHSVWSLLPWFTGVWTDGVRTSVKDYELTDFGRQPLYNQWQEAWIDE